MEYRVLLVESTSLMLERLSAVIKDTPGFTVAERFLDASDALGQGTVFRPNIILIDVEKEENVFAVQRFVQTFPTATVICLCNRWDPEMTSRVVRVGAKGCLIKPFTSEELTDAIETFNKSGLGVSSDVIAFFSPKGKSGKTTLIANLAMRLSAITNSSVGIIDADVQFGDMAIFFGLKPQRTITEATRDVQLLSPVSLKSYFVSVDEHVSVLCGTRTPEEAERVDPNNLTRLIRMARAAYRYILVDLPASFNPISLAAAEAADQTCIVAMENGGFEVSHVKRAIQVFEEWDDIEERLKVVFTRVSPCDDTSRQRLSAALSYPVTGILPNAYDLVSKAADEGRMAMDISPSSDMARAIDFMAKSISTRNQGR